MEDKLNLVHVQVKLTHEEHRKLGAICGNRNQGNYMRQLVQDVIAGKTGYPYPETRPEHELFERVLTGERESARLAVELLKKLDSRIKPKAQHRGAA